MKHRKHYWENLDLAYKGQKWQNGLVPALIAGLISGVITYITAHYYGTTGVYDAMDACEEKAKQMNDVIDNRR